MKSQIFKDHDKILFKKTKYSSTPFLNPSKIKLKQILRKISISENSTDFIQSANHTKSCIESCKDNLYKSEQKWDQQKLLGSKLQNYRKDIEQNQKQRVKSVTNLIQYWYRSTNKTSPRDSRAQSMKNTFNNRWFQPNKKKSFKKSGFINNINFPNETTFQKQNKLLKLSKKSSSKYIHRDIYLKMGSFIQKRSSNPLVLNRQRSTTKVISKRSFQIQETYFSQILKQIQQIMQHPNLSIHQKMNKLVDLKIKLTNISTRKYQIDSYTSKCLKDSMLSLYNSIFS